MLRDCHCNKVANLKTAACTNQATVDQWLLLKLCISPCKCWNSSKSKKAHVQWSSSWSQNLELAWAYLFHDKTHHNLLPHSSINWAIGFALVCKNCHNNISQTGWLKQQKSILSWLWMVEVQDKRICAGLVLSYGLPLGLADSSFTWLCLCIPGISSSSNKDASQVMLG